MAPHSSTLAWKISWTEAPGGLQSMGSLRVRHNWATLLSLFTFMRGRRKWQPTPVFLPGESRAAVYGVAQSRTRLKRLSSKGEVGVFYSGFFSKTPLSLGNSLWKHFPASFSCHFCESADLPVDPQSHSQILFCDFQACKGDRDLYECVFHNRSLTSIAKRRGQMSLKWMHCVSAEEAVKTKHSLFIKRKQSLQEFQRKHRGIIDSQQHHDRTVLAVTVSDRPKERLQFYR